MPSAQGTASYILCESWLQEVDPAKTEALVLKLSKLDSLATIPEGDEAAEPSTAADTSGKDSAAVREKPAKAKVSADKRKTSEAASQAPAESAAEDVPTKRKTRAKPAPKYEEGTDEEDLEDADSLTTEEEDDDDDDGLPPSRPKVRPWLTTSKNPIKDVQNHHPFSFLPLMALHFLVVCEQTALTLDI